MKIIEGFGFDLLFLLSFNRKLAMMSAEQFLDSIRKIIDIRIIVIGWDFHFGRDNKAGREVLIRIGEQEDFTVIVVDPVVYRKGVPISSSLIRELISSGNIEEANKLLGRKYTIEGKIVKGEGIAGNILKTPTINISTRRFVMPGKGIYITETAMGNRIYKSISYIGSSPTLKPGFKERVLEVHNFGFKGKNASASFFC